MHIKIKNKWKNPSGFEPIALRALDKRSIPLGYQATYFRRLHWVD
jgi:hypothetical protein